MKIRIAHIINPFNSPEGSEHAIAQPITFESIIQAKSNCTKAEVELYAAIEKQDTGILPKGFKPLFLESNLASIATFNNARTLPFIQDILSLLNANSNADFFIYSNIDIGLQPNFYDAVCVYLNNGHDSVVVNRRGISEKFNTIEQLNNIYKEQGKSHPGYDCFIFKRELCEKFIFEKICIGLPRFERVFIFNLIAFSKNPLFIEEEKLTFHIGEAVLKNWGDKHHLQHNQNEYIKIKSELLPLLNITKFPYWNLFFIKRYWKWLWNPNFSLPFNLMLEWRYRIKGY